MRKETRCVHSGTVYDSIAGGINSPRLRGSVMQSAL